MVELQIRRDKWTGFGIIVVASDGVVRRFHEVPDGKQVDAFFTEPITRKRWKGKCVTNDRPEDYGELIARRTVYGVDVSDEAALDEFIEEVETCSYSDRLIHKALVIKYLQPRGAV